MSYENYNYKSEKYRQKKLKYLESELELSNKLNVDSSSDSSSSESENEYDQQSGNESMNVSHQKTTANTFKNDGSFMQMFQKLQQQKHKISTIDNKSDSNTKNTIQSENLKESSKTDSKQKPSSSNTRTSYKNIGRRSKKCLPTGIVKKQLKEVEPSEKSLSEAKDPWSKYMEEVRKYKQQSCTDDHGDPGRAMVK